MEPAPREVSHAGDRQVRRPVLIVGSPRSGTTLLGDLMATHPEVAYWEEPRTIWSQGNAWRGDDRLDAADLTPSIARRIDQRFDRFLRDSGKARFVEKTPSNALRLDFIRAVYPDARVIHLIRDGRAVVGSMLEMLATPPRPDRIAARVRETPWRDLPALAPVFFRDLVVPLLSRRGKSWWGPRVPGWQTWSELPIPVMLARQWASLVTAARSELRRNFPPNQWLELKYEDLVSKPDQFLPEICRVAELEPDSGFLASASASMDAIRIDRWRETLGPEIIEKVEAEAGALLEQLGYCLVTGADQETR